MHFFQLIATKLNGKPANNENIQICVKSNPEPKNFVQQLVGCNNYTTNNEGSIRFKIAPLYNTSAITLVVSI